MATLLTNKELDKVTGGRNNNITTLKCPRCDEVIETTMEHIIQSQSIICPHCGLKLTIDKK